MAQNLSPQNGPQNICNQNIVHKHGSIFFFWVVSWVCKLDGLLAQFQFRSSRKEFVIKETIVIKSCLTSWATAPVWVSLLVFFSFLLEAVINLQQNTTFWSLSHFLRIDCSKRHQLLATWKLSLWSFCGKYCTIKDGSQTYNLIAEKSCMLF